MRSPQSQSSPLQRLAMAALWHPCHRLLSLSPGLAQCLPARDLVVSHPAHRRRLILGFGFYAGTRFADDDSQRSATWMRWLSYALLVPALYALVRVVLMQQEMSAGAMRIAPEIEPGISVTR